LYLSHLPFGAVSRVTYPGKQSLKFRQPVPWNVLEMRLSDYTKGSGSLPENMKCVCSSPEGKARSTLFL
jgi:hypothetical protein